MAINKYFLQGLLGGAALGAVIGAADSIYKLVVQKRRTKEKEGELDALKEADNIAKKATREIDDEYIKKFNEEVDERMKEANARFRKEIENMRSQVERLTK